MGMRKEKQRAAERDQAAGGPGALPAALEAERRILGALLTGQATVREVKLQGDAFFSRRHQRIFEGVKATARGRGCVDLEALAAELRRAQEPEAAGDLRCVGCLLEGASRISDVAEDVENVREKCRLRRLVHVARAMEEITLLQDRPAREIADEVKAALGKICAGVGRGGR
jgi:replicative DNA helicase